MEILMNNRLLIITCTIALILINIIYVSFYPLTTIEEHYSSNDASYKLIDEVIVNDYTLQLYKSQYSSHYQLEKFLQIERYKRWRLVSSISIDTNKLPAITALNSVNGIYIVSIDNGEINISLDKVKSNLSILLGNNRFLVFDIGIIILAAILYEIVFKMLLKKNK